MPLPTSWPSAWPDLRRRVGEGAAAVVLTVLLTGLGTWWLGAWTLAWWVSLLPAPLLAGPLSRPARTRAALRRRSRTGGLRARRMDDGLLVSAGRHRAVITGDGRVRYVR